MAPVPLEASSSPRGHTNTCMPWVFFDRTDPLEKLKLNLTPLKKTKTIAKSDPYLGAT
jgi:hypothetical protein